MTLSLTCACGARLEIDAKFAGQTIHCPDCKRALNTAPPALEPPRTSGLALASFLLALIGAFTLVGTIAAVVCGVMALAHIKRLPEEIGGRRFAQAGIGLGIAFTLLTLVALWTTELFRLDGVLRTIEWAGKIEYPAEDIISTGDDVGRSGSIQRPTPGWAKLRRIDANTPREKADDLILVNLWEDAHIVCLTKWLEPGQPLEACRQEGQQRFLQSELVTRILGRTAPNSPPPAAQDRERKQLPGTETQEFVLDLRLAGVERTFLVRVLRDGARINIVAGGTRRSRFARLQPELIKALDSYKIEN